MLLDFVRQEEGLLAGDLEQVLADRAPHFLDQADAIAAGRFAAWEASFHAKRAEGDIPPL